MPSPPGPPSSRVTFAEQAVLALLLEKTEQGFWFIDNELRTTDANPAMCRMLRLRREDMLGRSIYDFVDEANAEIFRDHVRFRSQGVADGYEIALTRSDGSQVDCYNNATPVFAADGRKVGAIGLFSDISQQKRDQRELARTGQLLAQKSRVLEQTLDSLSQGVLSLDADGHVTAYNQRMLTLLDLPQTLLAEHPPIERILQYQLEKGQLDAAASDLGRRALAGELRQPDYDPRVLGHDHYRRRTRDGRVLEIDSHVAPGGEVVRTYTDITDRLRAEDALIAARDEAERANQAKSQFLSRMSHELRTPLNAILGFAQLMDADADEPLGPAQRRRLAELRRGGQHLLSLINEVLDLARIEAGAIQVELAPVALWPLVEECLQLVAPTAEARGVRFDLIGRFAGAASQPHVHADVRRLRQVLINLLSNAIKYNRPKGSVRLWCNAHEGQWRLSVHDEGPGLDETQRGRLFSAFERLDADHRTIEGAGIGLALSKQLVELMHGSIGVSSRPGEGSTFWIGLPASAAADTPTADTAAPDVDTPALRTRRSRVLYIEDNEVNQLLVRSMLERRPLIELQQALEPLTGLDMAQAEPPALVLLDIQLPGLHGFEVLRRLRAAPTTARVPVIALSANAMQSDIDAALAIGFDAYLTKPVDMAQLLSTIDRWLADPAGQRAARR
jgi:PAS domain S-box-containing protein